MNIHHNPTCMKRREEAKAKEVSHSAFINCSSWFDQNASALYACRIAPLTITA